MKFKPLWIVAAVLAIAVTAKLILAATAFTPADQPTGYLAQLEVTNFNLTSGNETVFKVDYDREKWSGNVFAFPVSSEGVINTPAEWWSGGAAARMDLQNFDTGRNIVTMKEDGSKVPFRWTSLSAAQQASIGNATEGPKILNYVRGQRDNEIARNVSGTYRDRRSEERRVGKECLCWC